MISHPETRIVPARPRIKIERTKSGRALYKIAYGPGHSATVHSFEVAIRHADAYGREKRGEFLRWMQSRGKTPNPAPPRPIVYPITKEA